VDPGRLTTGHKIAGGAGLVLLISLWLNWYSVDLGNGILDGFGVGVNANAWQAFGLIDLLLFVTSLVAIASAVLAASDTRLDLPVTPGQVVTALAALCVLLILYRLVDRPIGPNEVISIQYGAFIGLLAAAGVAFGGFRLMQEEGSIPGREDEGRGTLTGARSGAGAAPGAGSGTGAGATPEPQPPSPAAPRHPESEAPPPPESREP
jgi:hypothetical protein